MSDTRLPFAIEFWKHRLGVENYSIICQRISIQQVCDENLQTGHEFVGICTDHKQNNACLFHTRQLNRDDIIHELLHVKYPQWTEMQVNNETERLLKML